MGRKACGGALAEGRFFYVEARGVFGLGWHCTELTRTPCRARPARGPTENAPPPLQQLIAQTNARPRFRTSEGRSRNELSPRPHSTNDAPRAMRRAHIFVCEHVGVRDPQLIFRLLFVLCKKQPDRIFYLPTQTAAKKIKTSPSNFYVAFTPEASRKVTFPQLALPTLSKRVRSDPLPIKITPCQTHTYNKPPTTGRLGRLTLRKLYQFPFP